MRFTGGISKHRFRPARRSPPPRYRSRQLLRSRSWPHDNRVTQMDTYERLVALLDARDARYRLIDHPAEGRTELVSAMRGHSVAQAAKCIVVMVKLGKKITKF